MYSVVCEEANNISSIRNATYGRTSMENKLGKKRLSLAVLALLTALLTAMFAASCGGGESISSDNPASNGSVSIIDGRVTTPDADLPAYTTYADYPSLDVNALRARRDELMLGIRGSGSTKGYRTLFEEASSAENVVEASKIVYDLDPQNAKYNELVSKVNNYIGEAKTTAITESDCLAAAKLLYEDHDLNGLYGIYQTAYRFYGNFVYKREDLSQKGNGGYLSEDPDDLAGYKSSEIIESAKKVLQRKLKITGKSGDGHSDCSVDCNATYAIEYVKEFESTTLTAIVGANETDKAKVEDAQKTLDFYYHLLYKSGKYEDSTVNEDSLTAAQIVYGGEGISADDAEIKAEQDYKVVRAFMDADYKLLATSSSDLDLRLSKKLKEYFEKATVEKGLRRYTEAALQWVNKFGKTSIDVDDTDAERDEKTDNAIIELALVEHYLSHFDSLGTYTLELSGGTKKVDLKSVSFADDGEETDNEQFKGADWNDVRDILNKYPGLTKSAIEVIRLANANKYGISADATVSNNVNIANKLADTLTGRYGDEKPRYTGEEIAKGFKNSYAKNGALSINGESTKSVDWYKNVASLTYVPAENEKIFVIDALNNIFPPDNFLTGIFNKIFPQERIPSIKVTAVDKDGNEIKCFDGNAKLKAVFGGTPATERNINLILNDDDKLEVATSGLNENEKVWLNGANSLKYYLSLSILAPAESADAGKSGGNVNYIPMDEKELDRIKELNEGMRFKVELTFDKEKVQNASEFVAIGYAHSKIKFVCDNEQEIKDGDEDIKMTFFLDNVTTAMSVGILSQDSFKNIALFVAIGVIALIVIILIVWAIVAHARRKRYKVKYNALGGRFSNGQKVKYSKNYGYPNNPTRKGYQFMGWYTNKKCTRKFNASGKYGKCVTVYAKWLPQSKYDKLNEAQEAITKKVNACSDYRGKANGTAGTGIHQTAIGYDEDPRITKLQIEKLSYEAKKAEEERKAEEVRLQTIREIEAAKDNDNAKEIAEREAEKAKLALQQALAEREALISLAKAEERNKVLEELRAAEAKTPAATGVDESKVNEIIDNKLKAYDAERAKEIAAERERLSAELAAKIAAEQALNAAVVAPKAEEDADKFNAGKVFDELKAELLGYKPGDDLDFDLNDSDVVAAVKVNGNAVILQVDADKADLEAKGFVVSDGETLPVKMLVENDDDVAEAKELIEEVLYANGFVKSENVPVTECGDAERNNGFELNASKGRKAATPEEFLKLIRVYAKSFVLANGEPQGEKLLMKTFLAGGKVYMYLNSSAEGTNASDDAMKAEGLGSFMVVKTADDCKKALKAISSVMRENGLVRYPSATSIKEDSSDKGFAYTLKA